ncbi:radial spoke head protein 6 homolog A [Orussus abietinus]|uniref:radial spoke head protein 6 homolog A n=1 Tax=Orussus abietinus TaxID=222816 RepID=UPI000625B0A9|nr:radial spoke head protein 6 homolog A [Orussus abietinus]
MAYSYDLDQVPPADSPCVRHDIRRAKKFLQKHSDETGDSLYDHLSEVLNRILSEKPKNAVDVFEEYSRKVKAERFKTRNNHLRDVYVPPPQYHEAKQLMKLFQDSKPAGDGQEEKAIEDEETDAKKGKPNMLDLLFYFEQTDVGLPRAEMVLLNLAIRKLVTQRPIENVRFWGKVLGNSKSYYVVEADFKEEELGRRTEKMEAEEQSKREKEEVEALATTKTEEDAANERAKRDAELVDAVNSVLPPETPGEDQEDIQINLVFPPLPKSTWTLPPEIPLERPGTGANAKVYFVCNSPGLDDWVELPLVTPKQIVVARQIVHCCTGNLNSPLFTYPPFPGKEENYLRAQIARISAATLISPIGYFTFGTGDEEEIDEEEESDGNISENPHYDPLSIKDLVDPSMSNWCHHNPFLLKQGRTVWWNPKKSEDEGEEEALEEEEEEEETEDATEQKEVGPPLLTPLSEDAILDSIPPWTVRKSSNFLLDVAVAMVRSNIWPGAYAFTHDKRFGNIYIGWGNKYVVYNYSPPPLPPVQDQYPIGPEIMEIADPTVDEEEAYRLAHLPAPKVIPFGEEEESPMEDLDEDDEEDD